MTAVSITAPQFGSDPALIRRAAKFAEAVGLAGVYAFDHLVPMGRPDGPVFDLASTLGTVAASTSRITVGSMIMRVGVRTVEESAALARSIRAIAAQRTVMGLGTGDSMTADEQRRFALGAPTPAERRALMAATADQIRTEGGIVVLGGTHQATQDLVLDHADGWNAWGLDLDRFSASASRLRSARPSLRISWGASVLLGRDAAEAEDLATRRKPSGWVNVWSPDLMVKACRSYLRAGADEILVTLVPNRPDRWEVLSERVLPALA